MLDDAYELARAGDPLRAALATYRYTGVRLRRGEVKGVLRAVDQGHELLDGEHSPTANVDIHYVRVPVELRDGTTAVGRAEQVHLPPDAQPSRAGHHWIDLARAWTLHGDRTKALSAAGQLTSQTTPHSAVQPQR